MRASAGRLVVPVESYDAPCPVRVKAAEFGIDLRVILVRRCLPGLLTRRTSGFGVDQRCNSGVAAQLVQASGAARPDAADRDAQTGADHCVRHSRILDEQGD